MEIPMSHEEEEMPMPLNTRYVGGGGGGHHEPIIQLHNITPPSPPPPHQNQLHNDNNNNNNNIIQVPNFAKKMVTIKYKECLKNHAASMGGNATDGCGEFMPSGQDGTLEALICSACNCHRNFHRKEVEGQEYPSPSFNNYYNMNSKIGRKIYVGHPQNIHTGKFISYNNNNDDNSDEEGLMIRPISGGGGGGQMVMKKRFRTKFSQEQKEKMLKFAERVGWKLQKQEEAVVQQLCQEIGVKRRVLKVWMHNNKLNYAKKNNVSVVPNDHISDHRQNQV